MCSPASPIYTPPTAPCRTYSGYPISAAPQRQRALRWASCCAPPCRRITRARPPPTACASASSGWLAHSNSSTGRDTRRRPVPMIRKTVLLAGAGDLCRRAGRLLLNQGHQVWGLRRHPPPHDASGIQWLAGDLTRAETLSRLPRDVSHVIYGPAPDARNETLYRAVFNQGLENLLERLDPTALRRLVFISSSAVYGDHGDAWVDENTP